MIPLFALFDFLNSLSRFQMILLGLVPVFLVLLSFLRNKLLRRAETVGYVCNGSILMMLYFVVFLGSVFAQYSVKWLPRGWIGKSVFESASKDGVPDNSVLWYLIGITILYFICYFFIAIRPVTATQMERAKKEEKIVFELSSSAIGHAASSLAISILSIVGSFLSAIFMAALHSLLLLLGGFLGAILLGVILLPIFGGLAIFGTLFLMFASILIVWVLCVYKFIKNTYIVAIGPAKAGYKIEGIDD